MLISGCKRTDDIMDIEKTRRSQPTKEPGERLRILRESVKLSRHYHTRHPKKSVKSMLPARLTSS